jgi:hypothetical protein
MKAYGGAVALNHVFFPSALADELSALSSGRFTPYPRYLTDRLGSGWDPSPVFT